MKYTTRTTILCASIVLSIMKDALPFRNRDFNAPQPLMHMTMRVSSGMDTMSKTVKDSIKKGPSQRVHSPSLRGIQHNRVTESDDHDLSGSSALILVPGCFIGPEQYDALVESIQHQSAQNLWVIVPNVPLGAATPLTIRKVIKDAIKDLRHSGFTGQTIFLGGHSIGAAFLPNILEEFVEEVAGLVMLGCFVTREKLGVVDSNQVPTLTLCGELDGLVRTSRIAESYHHAITSKGGTDEAKLTNPVVLIEGMNHFQYATGVPNLMKNFRDLSAETDDRTAMEAVGLTVAQFLDYHSGNTLPTEANNKVCTALLDKVDRTGAYLQPLIQAMKLEGNYHIAPLDASPEGSPWTQYIQKAILQHSSDYLCAEFTNPCTLNIDCVSDEFHESWHHFHPKIDVKKSLQGETTLTIRTCTEAVYDKMEGMLDTGFFSNTCVELRAKLNSFQAVQLAMGEDNVPYEEIPDVAGKMNELTIQWALENVPESVRQRYLQRGIPLVAGKDSAHKTGPGWIWSSLSFQRDASEDPVTGKIKDCTVVVSHTLSTPVNHPIPFVGGKMYCKLLSPARAMEYMYTDSLRPSLAREDWYWMMMNVRIPSFWFPEGVIGNPALAQYNFDASI